MVGGGRGAGRETWIPLQTINASRFPGAFRGSLAHLISITPGVGFRVGAGVERRQFLQDLSL